MQITEIYKSLQGESTFAGLPCTFIRLTGCPLRCKWCDTAYAFKGGSEMSIEEILKQVRGLKVPLVELTGGEPLAQPEAKILVDRLIEEGFQVLIETSGSESIRDIHPKSHIIMDLKCPGSKMSDRNLWENLEWLQPHSEIKFVISERGDFDWALEKTLTLKLTDKCEVLFSPAFGLVKPKDLAQWIIDENAPVRMQIQQHKYIWDPKAKGV